MRVRFWTEVEGKSPTDSTVRAAVRSIGKTGWAAELLSFQFPDGHWVTPGASERDLYRPKYIVTNWAAIVLADLGMTRADPRVRKTAEMILKRWSAPRAPLNSRSREICIIGNAVRTLIRFGYLDHPTVQKSIRWILQIQKSDGGWNCYPSRRGTLDGWEGLAALAEIPEGSRDDAVRESIERGAEFYLQRHLMKEGRGTYKPWFRIHYPNHYYYDLMVGLRVLTRLGYGADPRMAPALRWLRSKRGRDGSWPLEASHPDLDEFAEIAKFKVRRPIFPMILEQLGQPSEWATVEALTILARSSAE